MNVGKNRHFNLLAQAPAENFPFRAPSNRAQRRAASTARRFLMTGNPFTRSQRREIERRKNLMLAFHALLEKGLTKSAAAKELDLPYSTLWRWTSHGVIPRTANCGRETTIRKLNPPAAILFEVRLLQLAGKSNAEAWHSVADLPQCPEPLREYLKTTVNISPSLLAATKLKKRKATVIEGPEIFLIQNT